HPAIHSFPTRRSSDLDRPEVQALQKQMLDGMKALKASRLGEGDKNPLYSMPWYAIVGPPGAGKTTALRHSGLSFPYLDSTGGGRSEEHTSELQSRENL